VLERRLRGTGFDPLTEAGTVMDRVRFARMLATAFAESEVTSLLARGTLVFSGGVANNTCISHLLQAQLQRPVLLPEEPQLDGAYGAALLAMELG